MPELLGAAIAYIFSGTAIAAYATAIAYGIIIAVGVDAARKARHKATDAYNASLRDRMIPMRSASEYRRVVLGRQRVGGVMSFFGSTGPNKEKFAMVIALASHECDGVEAVLFNDEIVWPPQWASLVSGLVGNLTGAQLPPPGDLVDEQITVAPYARTDRDSFSESPIGNGVQTSFTVMHAPVAGTVTAGFNLGGGEGGNWQFFTVVSVVGTLVTLSTAPAANFTIDYQADITTSYARVRAFLGAPGQTVDTAVKALFPTKWTDSHPMSGCAGISVFFDYNEDALPNGMPTVSVIMRGAKVYDPRKDSTAGGTGSQRSADPTTWTWSENNALLIGYVTTSPLLGRQAWANVNIPQMAVAANVCDVDVDYSAWADLKVNGDPLVDANGTLRIKVPAKPTGVSTV
jgi:hypothetical protein